MYAPVPELNLLMELQDRLGFESYADGFGLTEFGDTSGIEAGWSKDPEFVRALEPFAQANGSGSMYALWRLDDRTDLATLPVVVFGDEGGQHVVARDLRELLQLLGYDCEISVDWDEAYFYRGDDHEHTDGHEAYVAWLDEHFGLAPADDPEAVVEAAQHEFGDRFAAWYGPYLPD
ncbi:hypothetical protein [Phytohabitans rumicis]|uniref:Knr4/Smi1-like domain-containing protein n=1 Tax=Phytohabitans rumicis TaxID=1076125 RepID=A0A6V8LIS5_9ACTN|nr:hypothetical protein [Phytohabitans rumicis]GFJ94066.1 hypothetical protein Prum_077080 [Phytohabitans rumicis]